MIESPKPRLKSMQRQLLAELLNRVPTHAAAHGFCRGRSIATFASPHVNQRVVLKLDLQDFFTTILAARVQACFRSMGYRETVSDALAGLCTNTTPGDVWPAQSDRQSKITERLYARPHLPQGAPTSPTLANLCAYRLDCRLTGLAEAAGANYTRYADDLAFSGGESLLRCARRFLTSVSATVLEEGFWINHYKTRIMPAATRQILCGLVVNERLSIPRTSYDQLKATLTNCVRLGSESQNRDADPSWRSHLEGRISFVERIHAERGRRLRGLFEQIDWSA